MTIGHLILVILSVRTDCYQWCDLKVVQYVQESCSKALLILKEHKSKLKLQKRQIESFFFISKSMRKFCLTRELEFPKCKISENFTYFCKFINGDCLEVVQRKPGFSKSQLVFFLWNSRSLSILMKIKIYYIFTFPAFDFLNFSLHEKKRTYREYVAEQIHKASSCQKF